MTAWSPFVFSADSKLQRCRAVSFLLSIVSPGDQWRNNSRKNEEMEPKQKQYSVVDMTGDGSKVRCCKEQYCIGTWNITSMNQGKLEVVKQEMARVNIDILGTSEPKWTGMGEFTSDDHFNSDSMYSMILFVSVIHRKSLEG